MKTPVLRRRRLTNHVEVDTEGSWAISYGDMITLLLSFFILFFSTNKDRDRMNAMEDALFTVLSKPDRTPASASPASAAEPKVEDKVRDELAAQVYKVGNRLIVEFPSVSFFHFGKVEVTKEGQKELEKFTKLFLPYAGNYVVGIRAFTDHKKVLRRKTARFQDNLELSALRSIASMSS
jgi:flagellar motor protein MotB